MSHQPIMTMGRKASLMRTSGGSTFPSDPDFHGKARRLAAVLDGNSTLAEAALLFLAENPDALLTTRPDAFCVAEPEPHPYPLTRAR